MANQFANGNGITNYTNLISLPNFSLVTEIGGKMHDYVISEQNPAGDCQSAKDKESF